MLKVEMAREVSPTGTFEETATVSILVNSERPAKLLISVTAFCSKRWKLDLMFSLMMSWRAPIDP